MADTKPIFQRSWAFRDGEEAASASLSVTTYNVLAHCYIDSSFFPYCSPQSLDFSSRFTLLVEELYSQSSDIFLLQELDFFEQLSKALSPEWAGIYSKRTGSKTDGCAIFYRRSRFRPVAHGTLEYNAIPRSRKDFPVGRESEHFWDYLRNNIGQLACLEWVGPAQACAPRATPPPACESELPRPTAATHAALQRFHFAPVAAPAAGDEPKRLLFLGNTHLYWDPKCPDVKVEQARYLAWGMNCLRAEVMGRLHAAAPAAPARPCFLDVGTVICGDTNTLPTLPAYGLLTTQGDAAALLPYYPPPAVPGAEFRPVGLPLRSAYREVLGREPPYTNFVAEFNGVRPPPPPALPSSRAPPLLTCPSPPHVPLPSSRAPAPSPHICAQTLDYIFYSRPRPVPPDWRRAMAGLVFDPCSAHLEPVAVLDLPPEAALRAQTALPSEGFPSDHLSMRALFRLAPTGHPAASPSPLAASPSPLAASPSPLAVPQPPVAAPASD
ncbi:putative carbon catabolite repressor protein 4 4 [Paratrimastix pyriformis]|uniref:Carbon catabolite repressor protein 4 4 n=1 Tax=Paratrimastix pyriformis TaxID=342808 RepID=A0ABQ8UMP3_9EUKA|nr:putative carbon catabolite repressor protein 4 4 [Paratrimastix pyriformis]